MNTRHQTNTIRWPLAMALLALSGASASAQPTGVLNYWESAGGNWTTAANWSRNMIPDGQDAVNGDDFAIIGGVDGTTMEGIAVGVANLTSSPASQPGGLVLGLGADDEGTLNIAGGASLIVSDTDFDGDGSVTVGDAGTGRLIMTGGNLNAVSLSSGGAQGSLIQLSGNANVMVNLVGDTSPTVLGRTTHITGPSVQFQSNEMINLLDTHTLVAEITGMNHSPLRSLTSAIVGGTLQVDFSNYTPTSTGSWDLITAPIISGSFDALEVVGNPGLALGEALSLRTVDMASDVLQLFVEQRLVLNVDRQSGNISITNPAGTPIPFDGYSIRSENGALDPNEWNSLQTQIGSGWTEANPDTDKLNEFRTTGVQNLGPQLLDLGDIFASPVPTEFGVEADDLVFTYSSPDRPQVEGIINYTGGSLNNNLVIYADPATGEVALQNASPFNVVLDAYTIVSGDNELRPGNGNWDSLDDQGVDGPDWQEANVGTGRVTEFNTGAGTLLSPNEAYELGELYTIGGSESLLFEFILANEDFTRTGNIVYGPAPIVGDLVGDYNQDGVVNAADYVVWRNNEGTNNVLPNDEIGGTIGAAQFNQWVDNFGNGLNNGAGSGAGAVPEPASGLLMACAITALAATRRHSPAILVGNLKQNPPGWRTQWNPPGWRGYGIG